MQRRPVHEPVRESTEDQQREQDREHLAHRDHAVAHPRGRRVDEAQRVRRAVGGAGGPRGRRRELVDEQRRRDVEQPDQQRRCQHERPVGAAREPPGREGEQEVDDRHLREPARDAPDAVGQRPRTTRRGRRPPTGSRRGRAGGRTARGSPRARRRAPRRSAGRRRARCGARASPRSGMSPRSAITTAPAANAAPSVATTTTTPALARRGVRLAGCPSMPVGTAVCAPRIRCGPVGSCAGGSRRAPTLLHRARAAQSGRGRSPRPRNVSSGGCAPSRRRTPRR